MMHTTTVPAGGEVDRHVGLRLKLKRKEAGLSQSALAAALGITFQQIQKYERGANRISASKLFQAAAALEVSVGYFFDGLSPAHAPGSAPISAQQLAFLTSRDGATLAAQLPRLPQRQRRKICELVSALAADEAEISAIPAE